MKFTGADKMLADADDHVRQWNVGNLSVHVPRRSLARLQFRPASYET